MLISYSHKFIFIHIHNTAGTSIKEALKEYAQEPEKFKINRPLKNLGGKPNLLYEKWNAVLSRAKAREVKKELPEEIYNNFYKFAFVRNPWDWEVSLYYYILRNPENHQHKIVKSMHSFEEYIEWKLTTYSHLQKDHITDDNKVIVDFIGRYENLEEDFNRVCNLVNINTILPASKNPVSRDYKAYYSDKSRKLIEDYLKEDIELFGYKFSSF